MRDDGEIDDREKMRRLLVAECMIELLRDREGRIGQTLPELLVGLVVVVSSFGSRPLGLAKIAEISQLPKTTVRRTLDNLCDQGAIERLEDKTFRVTREFTISPDRGKRVAHLERSIQRTGRALASLAKGRAESMRDC